MFDLKLSIQVAGETVASFVRKLRGTDEQMADSMGKAMQAFLLEVEGEAKRTTYSAAGLHRRSGDLLRGIGSGPRGILEVTARGRGREVVLVGRIGSDLIYFPVQEFGATITAKRAPYLHFPIRSGGGLGRSSIVGWAKVRSVTIPPRPFLRPAIENVTSSGRGAEVFDQFIVAGVQESLR